MANNYNLLISSIILFYNICNTYARVEILFVRGRVSAARRERLRRLKSRTTFIIIIRARTRHYNIVYFLSIAVRMAKKKLVAAARNKFVFRRKSN